jgi:hypothetical protein
MMMKLMRRIDGASTELSSVKAIFAGQLRRQFPLSRGAHDFGVTNIAICVCPFFHKPTHT